MAANVASADVPQTHFDEAVAHNDNNAAAPVAAQGGGKVKASFEYSKRCKSAPFVTLAFDNWQLHQMHLKQGTTNVYVLELEVPAGEQPFKYKVDDEFKTDFNGKIGVDNDGNICNLLE